MVSLPRQEEQTPMIAERTIERVALNGHTHAAGHPHAERSQPIVMEECRGRPV